MHLSHLFIYPSNCLSCYCRRARIFWLIFPLGRQLAISRDNLIFNINKKIVERIFDLFLFWQKSSANTIFQVAYLVRKTSQNIMASLYCIVKKSKCLIKINLYIYTFPSTDISVSFIYFFATYLKMISIRDRLPTFQN